MTLPFRTVTLSDIEKIAQYAVRDDPHPIGIFPPSVYYRFLEVLARNMKPELMVELGVCGGGGSFHLAKGNPDGKVIGIDIVDEYPDNIDFVKMHCKNFEFWRVDSLAAPDHISKKYPDKQIGILFIDTVHTYSRTWKEFRHYQHKLGDGAVVVFDDLFREGMQDVWDELPGEKIRLDHLHVGGSPTDGGFGAIII